MLLEVEQLYDLAVDTFIAKHPFAIEHNDLMDSEFDRAKDYVKVIVYVRTNKDEHYAVTAVRDGTDLEVFINSLD